MTDHTTLLATYPDHQYAELTCACGWKQTVSWRGEPAVHSLKEAVHYLKRQHLWHRGIDPDES